MTCGNAINPPAASTHCSVRQVLAVTAHDRRREAGGLATILPMRTMRPRLCVLREAAGAVFFGRPTTTSSASSPAWVLKKGMIALHKTALHTPLSSSGRHYYEVGALHCHCNRIVPNSPSSPLPLLSKRSFSTEHARKASSKFSSITKLRSRGSGKIRKQGSTTRRTVTVLASSSQHMASSSEGRDNRQSKAGVAKGSTRTALTNQEKSEVCSGSGNGNRSGVVHKQSQIRTRPKEGAAVSLSRRSSLMIKKTKTSQEDKAKREKSKGSTQNTGSQKKGKRVMRLDPQDTTSKRIYEGYPLPGEEVQEQTPAVSSSRGQFRQIAPPPKLLQHIERYMLGRRRPSELQRAGYDMKITPAPLDNIPYSKKGERQPIQEEVFRHKLRFAAAAKSEASLPPVDIPEVAFAGRSNVGKSSLINALTRQWGVARTSDKPGLTQSINFFRLGGRLCLVDLPGYGFAYAAEEKKEAWEEFVKEYVTTRAGLKRVYVLVDAKWGLKLKDEELIELMEKAGKKYQIVLTKSDTVTPMDLARRATQILEIFKDNKYLALPMVMVSSKTGEGLEFFRGSVSKLAKASLI